MPALSAGYKANFETLRAAVINGHAVLVDCQLRELGRPVAVICAVNIDDQFEFVPLAMLFDGNPYELLSPPDTGGGYLDPHAAGGEKHE